MLKQTLSALTLAIAMGGASVASGETHEAPTKESCEAAIVAAETHAATLDGDPRQHEENLITQAREALQRDDLVACAKALEHHHGHSHGHEASATDAAHAAPEAAH